jgi:cytochrome c biogenesis factor
MESRLAAGTIAFKNNIASLKTNPRRMELLKPTVMTVVSIIVAVVYSFAMDNAISGLHANPALIKEAAGLKAAAWGMSYYGLAFSSIMTAFLYLVGTYDNITRNKHENIFKLAATSIHTTLFLGATAYFFLANDHQRAPVLFAATTVLMATLLIMTALEKLLLKPSEPIGAAAA